MPRFFTLFIAALLFVVTTKGQQLQDFTISWEQPVDVGMRSGTSLSMLWGEQTTTLSHSGLLPWFVVDLQQDETFLITEASLSNLVYDTLLSELSLRLADRDLITGDFQLFIPDADSWHGDPGSVKILALRERDDMVERLLSFTLTYEPLPRTTPRFDDPMPDYAENSVLSEGDWYKIGVQETGIYKLTYNDLQTIGINPQTIDPRHIRLFGNGNGMLPEGNNVARIDDLFENAIYVHGEEDGVFDAADYILFYGLSPVRIFFNQLTNRFEHRLNHFTDTTFYFLTIDADGTQGRRIANLPEAGGAITHEVDKYLAYQYHETAEHNLLASGREWYGEEFSKLMPAHDFNFYFPGLITTMPVHMQMQFVARSVTEDISFNAEVNGQQIVSPTELRRVGVSESLYARESIRTASFNVDNPEIGMRINFEANDNGSRGWLNYIRINAWSQLSYNGGQFVFSNPMLLDPGSISRFHLTGAGQHTKLWDVTNPLLPAAQQFSLSTDGITYVASTSGTVRRYIAFDDSDYLTPVSGRLVPNQNLHSITYAEYLIITHPRFMESANELAEFHAQMQGLDTKVVNIHHIYNEFGGGASDITALRDFVRMVYLRSNENMKYLLLFGDASYDYKDRLAHNTNLVPTYQALESLRETASWVTDDYFGLMGYNEGNMMTGILDIGIGRFPVNTVEEANHMVAKVKHYMTPGPHVTGSWRNVITFVADDGDNNLHLSQAESLSRIVDTARTILNIKKLYFDAYPRQAVAGGFRFPDASKALINRVEEGSLFVNYTGHGGVNGLAEERVFVIPDIMAFENLDRMSIFITATCEFSRYDDPEFLSAGERLVMNPKGGAIALLTTTRLAFAHSNFFLNRKIYEAMFNSGKVEISRLGDAMRISKNPTSSSIYNFVLLGDPALRPASPEKRVKTSHFNNHAVQFRQDTIRAMKVVQVSGSITDVSGQTEHQFNGYLYPKVYDKKTTYRTLGSSNDSQPTNFSYHDRVIYSGKVTVTNGQFSFSFPVPRDIAYQYGSGRISYYAVDTVNFSDASGIFGDFVIGGIDSDVTMDTNGPEIVLYLNRPEFQSGDIIQNEVVVHARISDPQGINHFGVGIGRDILGVLNNNTAEAYNLNNVFVPDIDSYTSGSLTFKLPWLDKGEHSFRLKVWDLHNNSSETEVSFIIGGDTGIEVAKLYNAPNPFRDQTQFVFEHNLPGSRADVLVSVYRIDGQLLTKLEAQNLLMPNRIVTLPWDGRDANGNYLPSGIYIYRFMVTDELGNQVISTRKLVIAR